MGDITTANVYGSSFFMATGFHGAHVIIGTIFLAVCLLRLLAGQFTPTKHFGLEAAAWYWHFVDVVWLFLFTFVYVTPYLTMQRLTTTAPFGLGRGRSAALSANAGRARCLPAI